MSSTEKQPLAEDYFFYDQGGDTRRVVTTTTTTQAAQNKAAPAPVKKNADYNFYEGDIEDIHTGELYQYNDAPARIGLLAGILALLATLAIVGLTGVIFHRDVTSICNNIILSHLIIACVAVVVAALATFVCLQARQAMVRRVDLNHTLIGLSLILSIVFFCYFLASAVFIFMYRPFHYSNLISMNAQKDVWNEKFGDNWTFEDGWGEDRRILWWMALLSIVAAVGFLLLSISLWLMSKFPVQLARIILGASCLAGVILILFGLEYLIDARNILGNNYVLKNTNFDFLSTLLILLAVGGILLFVNAIWNLFKRRSGHFLFGTIFIIFVFIFVCFLGLILRDLRRNQFNNISSSSTYCRDLLDSFHADDIKNFCPSKYLPANASCSKAYLVSAWETTDKSYKFINPTCCHMANNYSLCPLYIAGILSLLFITTILIVIATNYYLSDRSEYLEFADKKFGIFELLFVVGIVLAIIGFGFWWGFKPATVYPRQNATHPTAIKDNFGSISEYKDPNFTPVDLNKVYGDNIPPSVYIQGAQRSLDPNQDATITNEATRYFTGNNVVTFKANPAKCANVNTCGFRVGILAINGRFDAYTGTSVLGTTAARNIFFDDNQLHNDFLFIYGKPEDLNNFVKLLRFVPIDISKESRLVFNAEQIDLLTLGANGLKKEESPAAPTLSASGKSFDSFGGYNVQNLSSGNACFANNTCQSTLKCFDDSNFGSSTVCKAAFVFYASNGTVKVRLPIKVFDANGKKVAYNENSLASKSIYIHEKTQYLINDMTLSGGEIAFSVPRAVRNNILVKLAINDQADHYLPYARNFVIPATDKDTYSEGEVLLLTRSGKGCIGSANPSACFAQQTLKLGNINLLVRDSDTGDLLSDMTINLTSGIDGTNVLATKKTDGYGKAVFENVGFDYYTVQFPGSLGYFPARQSFKVQSETDGNSTMFVRSKKSNSILLEQYVNNSDNVDEDFVLSVLSDNGAKCKVAPYNKYCAYAEHVNDITVQEEGFEKIKINKFAVAHYLGFIEQSPSYTGTCGASDLKNYGYYNNDQTTIRSLSFGWSKVRNLQNTSYRSLYCFTGYGLVSTKIRSGSSSAEPSAADCVGLYPDGSDYAVSKLRALFPRQA